MSNSDMENRQDIYGMESSDRLPKRKVKRAPPVPTKTYLWEDIRRAKRRGKYPYTYLYKGPYVERIMEGDQKPKHIETEKKRRVRKLKKMSNVDEPSTKKRPEEPELMKEQKDSDKSKDVPQETKVVVEMEVDVKGDKLTEHLEKMNIEEINVEETDQFAYKRLEEESPEDRKESLTITSETRDLSIERQTDEGKDVEMIAADSGKLSMTRETLQTETITEELRKERNEKNATAEVIGDITKCDTKTVESDDTYTSSNIEQYLDKEEISKSVSEATTSEADTKMETNQPDIPQTLEVPTDKKRKYSENSELTKSNLSLFEKMKKAKFKPPTFKIPKFKKLTFSKRSSKRVKTDPIVVAKTEIPLPKKKSESPVYIHIPLKPSPEEIEIERQQELLRQRFKAKLKQEAEAEKKDKGAGKTETTQKPTDATKSTSEVKTKPTESSPSKTDHVKVIASKWKGFQSKAGKKTPFKKSSMKSTNGKKVSPKTEKKESPAKRKLSLETKKDDVPAEYIHIPLKPTAEELEQEAQRKRAKPEERIQQVSAEEKQRTLVTTTKGAKDKKSKDTPKGAIKKTTKTKTFKESTVKISKDIKKLALKLKGVQKRSKKMSPKKSSLKKSEEKITNGKKSSPVPKQRSDSPTEYIHIPLTGPLVREIVKVERSGEELTKDETEPTEIQREPKRATSVEEPMEVYDSSIVTKIEEAKKEEEIEDKKQEPSSKSKAVDEGILESKTDKEKEITKKEGTKSVISKLKGLTHKKSKATESEHQEKIGTKDIETSEISAKAEKETEEAGTEQKSEITKEIETKKCLAHEKLKAEAIEDETPKVEEIKTSKEETETQEKSELTDTPEELASTETTKAGETTPVVSESISKETEIEKPPEKESKTFMSKMKDITHKKLKRTDSKVEEPEKILETKPLEVEEKQVRREETPEKESKQELEKLKADAAVEDKPKSELSKSGQKDEPKKEESKSVMSKLRSLSHKRSKTIDAKDETQPVQTERNISAEIKDESKVGEQKVTQEKQIEKTTASSQVIQKDQEKLSGEVNKESDSHKLMSKLKGFRQKISMSIDLIELPEALKSSTPTKTPTEQQLVSDADIEAMASKLFDGPSKAAQKEETQSKTIMSKLKRGFTISKPKQPDLKEEVEPMEVDIFATRTPTPPVHVARKEDIVNLNDTPISLETSITPTRVDETVKAEHERTTQEEEDKKKVDEDKKFEEIIQEKEIIQTLPKEDYAKPEEILLKEKEKEEEKPKETLQGADGTQTEQSAAQEKIQAIPGSDKKDDKKSDTAKQESKETEAKPETLMSKIKSPKHKEKKSPPAKKRNVKSLKSTEVEKTVTKETETEDDSEITDSADQTSMEKPQQLEEPTIAEPVVSHAPKIIGETLKKEAEQPVESSITKGTIMSKLKGLKHKPEKKSPTTKKKQITTDTPEVETKDGAEPQEPESVGTEHILISPKPQDVTSKGEEIKEVEETRTTSDILQKEHPTAECTEKDKTPETIPSDSKEKVAGKPHEGSVVTEKPVESTTDVIKSKLKGFTSTTRKKFQKQPTVEKEVSQTSEKEPDGSPTEYIHIPLKPTESELQMEAKKSEEAELKLTKDAEEIKKASEIEPVETSKSTKVEPEDVLKPEEAKVEQKALKKDEKTETDKPLQTSVIKESVKSTWRDIKQKAKSPPFKKKHVKKVSPKSEKKSSLKRTSPPVAKRRGDSPVEYIIIPLNPTAEQLAEEKEQEDKRKEEKREKQKAHTTRSQPATKEPSEKLKPKKENDKPSVKGAIRKQAEEKGKKLKESTSKLTEDIKKFAAKLKDIQKKSKKPTFKTFKRSSKVASGKKVSPTHTKKTSSDGRRSPPKPEKHGDSPVQYIHIPLKPTEEELRQMKINEEILAKSTETTTEPSSVTEITEEVEKLDLSKQETPPETEKAKESDLKESSKDTTEEEPKAEDSKKDGATKEESKKELKKEVESTFTSQTALDTLKKTKQYGMNKLKALKEAVQPIIDKTQEKKIDKPIDEKVKETIEVKRDTMFISLKDGETPKTEVFQTEVTTEEKPELPAKTRKEPPPIPVKKRRKRDSVKERVSSADSSHHYEPISKEDEEDGLKRVVTITQEDKPAEEPTKATVENAESGLDLSLDDNVIYESIEIKGERCKNDQNDAIFQNLQKSKEDEEREDVSLKDIYKKWSTPIDHEYEPINPPSEPQTKVQAPDVSPPSVHGIQPDELNAKGSQVTELTEPRLLRIPLDKELVVPAAEDQDLTSLGHSQADTTERTTSQETRSKTDDKLLSTPEISSRTEGISTSQIESSALEALPLRKESRTKETMAQQESQTRNIQEKIKTQAGKLKTKLKGIKKPSFTIPNPKFSPKFRRPKFDRPKFHKPKFERPKFQRPKFERPKFETPKFTMPKMPEMRNINFPSFNLSRPASKRPSADDRQVTTESSADSRRNIFDFRTYPRLFDKTRKQKDNITTTTTSDEAIVPPEFATVPRAAARKKGPVGARWVHRFSDIKYADDDSKGSPTGYRDELSSKDRGDSLERRMEADFRYKQALEEADDDMRDYERENQDINLRSYNPDVPERWKHGSFKKPHAPLEDMEDIDLRDDDQDGGQHGNVDEHSSIASSHRGGVLEEIDSDQFFLREKGISQDNIQVGLYLSSEIRDAFRQPVNALSQMEGVQPGYGSRDYELDASDLSLTRPNRPKRKHLKKTKRIKKTPHASEEHLPYDQESVNTEPDDYRPEFSDYKTFPPARPRRAKKSKPQQQDQFVFSQTDMAVDDELNIDNLPLKSQEDLQGMPNILGYVEKDLDVNEEYNKYLHDERLMYENEMMEGIEQPEIVISPDQKYEIAQKDIDKFLQETGMVETPKPPTRRQKSLRSLSTSEHDSIIGEFNRDKIIQDMPEQEINVFRVEHEYIIPADEAPVAPVRRVRSRSRSSQADDDRTSRGVESIETEECHEPPCVVDIRDSMGYAVIDKSKTREPPLPSAPKRRRSTKSNKSARSSETKFFTVPRPLNDTPPTRPTRNYSTLGPNRPPRKKPEQELQTDEEKENIDISQYIEIEDDEHSRDLQSGEVISKMKSRPLPAPPRPPRKTRDPSKEALRDITQETNIIESVTEDEKLTQGVSLASPQMEAVEEITVSTQTDPLPDDFCCEEVVQEPTDRVVAPSRRKRSLQRDSSQEFKTPERPKTPLERSVSPHAMVIEKQVQTPIEDETITHASLLVRPVPEYPPDSFVSKRFAADIPDIIHQRVLPLPTETLRVEDEDEFRDSLSLEKEELNSEIRIHPLEDLKEKETIQKSEVPLDEPIGKPPEDIVSKETEIPQPEVEVISVEESETPPVIPEKPRRKKSIPVQPQIIERIIERQVPVCVAPGPDTEVEILKAQRLQVTDLDVERLNVSELQAQKILVSEIDGVSLQISELTSKSGNLIVNGLEIPSGLIQEILDRLQPGQSVTTTEPSSEQVATQTTTDEHEQVVTDPAQMEQVSTQTSVEGTEESTQTPEEPQASVEQVATQTSLDEPDNNTQHLGFTEPRVTEQVATQTSIDEPEDTNIPSEHIQLTTEPDKITLEETILVEEPEYSSILEESPRLTQEPIIIITSSEENLMDLEDQQLENIKERIRSIESEMTDMTTDITDIKTEIEKIIDTATEQILNQNVEESDLIEIEQDVGETESETLLLSEPIPDLESVVTTETDPILTGILKTLGSEEQLDVIIEDKSEEPVLETATTELVLEKPVPQKTIPEMTITQEVIPQLSSTTPVPEDVTEVTDPQEQIIPQKTPKETEHISKVDEPSEAQEHKRTKSQETTKPSLSTDAFTEQLAEQTESSQSNHSHPPVRPPLPHRLPEQYQEQFQEQEYILHEIPHPMSYYPEYVQSLPPQSFYTLRTEEEIPVHHRRRRHHRRYSRSSSEEDERRTTSRRRTEPSIPQLSCQLVKACTNSTGRYVRQLINTISTQLLTTEEDKQNFKIAMVILLVLIAGLILLGYGSGGKTIHLHHWEYFNPPNNF